MRPDIRWPVRTMKPQENRFSRGSKKMKRPCIRHGLRFIRWACISLRKAATTLAKEFLPSYRGAMVLLIQHHRPLQVVTPRTLAEFHGETLVLPSVSGPNETERQGLKAFVDHGGRLVVLGEDVSGIPQSAQKIALPADPARASTSTRWRANSRSARRILPRNS